MVLFALITSILGTDSKFYGKPVEVTATFEVIKDKEIKKEIMQQSEATSNYSFLKKRPRPFLNALGQIEFHGTRKRGEKPRKTTIKPITTSAPM